MARLKFILKSRFSHALLNTYISCSTKHGERTWQSLTYHIKTCSNIRKLFHSKSKPSESEKNDTEEEERINQEETDEGKETEKITNFPENLVARSHIRWVPETFHARFPRSVKSYKWPALQPLAEDVSVAYTRRKLLVAWEKKPLVPRVDHTWLRYEKEAYVYQ